MSIESTQQRGRFGRLGFALLLLALSPTLGPAPAGAQEGPPRFFIEEITVDAPRLSPEIVVSESLLRTGKEYTEAELGEAVHRINRLPFVLLAEFSLRKGSERGRYELVIKVFETRRWFFEVGGNWDLDDTVEDLDPRVENEIGSRIGRPTDDLRSLVGRRFALGSRGLLFASFGTEDGAYALGYQRYNLFDRNILLSLSVAGEDEVNNVIVGSDSLTARAQLGIPVRGNHGLRLLASWSRDDRQFLFGDRFDTDEIEAEIAWVFNSLDDPVLPREGSFWEAGLTWSDRERVDFVFMDGGFERSELSGQSLGVIGAVGRHWPVAERQSLSLTGRGFLGEGLEGSRVWEAEASAGHQVFLMRRLELDKWRELRFETQVSALRQDFGEERGRSSLGPISGSTVDSWRLRTGLVYRNGWGLFRLFLERRDVELR